MLSLKLALKFYLSKKYGPLARFMSIASTTGIALGVAALIIGLSAMNGFERELHSKSTFSHSQCHFKCSE